VSVLEKLVPVEREVTALEDGRSFIMRILPYRTTDGRIDGIVVILIDITERKRAEEMIRRQVEELRVSNDELMRLNGVMEGRELRMIELKKEVNELLARMGEPARYPLDFGEEDE
jgi:two-component system CheB/CheR fusion protein